MSWRALALNPVAYVLVGVVALVAAFALGGSKAAAGMGLGLGSAAFNLIALWFLISLLGANSSKADASKTGTTLILIAFMLKVPVYVLVGVAANRIGNPAPGCFIGGVGLVYSCLVGWALAKS